MKHIRGIKLLEEREGEGRPAAKGDRVVHNVKLYLNKGDEVALNERQAQTLPASLIRREGEDVFIDHTTTLGKRQSIAGVEHALMGMRVGGYRKVKIGPHVAYGARGLPGLIPPHAVLIAELWLRAILSDD